MNYRKFKELFRKYPFFRSSIFEQISNNPNVIRNQVTGWIKKGYVVPLKRGVYTLNDTEGRVSVSLYLLSNILYSPSYISLETALDFYGIIPESVVDITAVTTKKTADFSNKYGVFRYYSIIKNLFDDFIAVKDEFDNAFFIASPERAMIDFFYYRMKNIDVINVDIFDLSYRFQNVEVMDLKKIISIAEKFNNNRVKSITNLFVVYCKEYHGIY